MKIVEKFTSENSKNVDESYRNNYEKDDICNMFNNIAPNYDLINHLTSLGIDNKWRNITVSEAGNIKNKKIIV